MEVKCSLCCVYADKADPSGQKHLLCLNHRQYIKSSVTVQLVLVIKLQSNSWMEVYFESLAPEINIFSSASMTVWLELQPQVQVAGGQVYSVCQQLWVEVIILQRCFLDTGFHLLILRKTWQRAHLISARSVLVEN